MFKNLAEPFSNILYKISDNSVIRAIRKGLICMMPLFLIGAGTSLLINFPFQPYREFMSTFAGSNWQSFLSSVYQGTFQIVSLGALLSICYFLVREKNEKRTEQIHYVAVMLVSACCFFIFQYVEEGNISFSLFGQNNMLLSIAISVIATSLFFFFYDHKLFKLKLFTADSDILFTQTLYILEPALWTIICFSLVKAFLLFMNITDLNVFIYDQLSTFILPQDPTLTSALFYMFSLHFFWFFGIHGSAVTVRILLGQWYPPLEENIAAVAEGLIPENILNDVFFDNFVTLGGSGAALCLILAILIKARKTNTHKLAKFSLPMALFNANELLIYGLPIVLNPVYLIPFLFVPIILVFFTYLVMSLGLVPVAAVRVPYTTPIILSGLQVTGSIRGSLLQIVNLIIGTCLYMPFVTISERLKEKSHFKVLHNLNDCVMNMEVQPTYHLLNRHDDIGYLARALAYDLQENLDSAGSLFLVYQPQVDRENHLYGCEALLRWNHKKFGFIPPPTIIAIAEESGLHSRLNEWIFTTALEALNRFKMLGHDQFIMSINISPLQLNNPNITDILRSSIDKNNLEPSFIEVELTENVALNDSRETRTALEAFKDLGVRLAIDDFGMGHTSIQYIRSFQFDTVKLDGSLVSDILTNESSKDIVRALVSLASNLDMHVIAEFVESEEQKEMLKELGCEIYQGYLYSKPLPTDTFEQYMSAPK